jgi:DNA-binding HxlR family transcriptional regulator
MVLAPAGDDVELVALRVGQRGVAEAGVGLLELGGTQADVAGVERDADEGDGHVDQFLSWGTTADGVTSFLQAHFFRRISQRMGKVVRMKRFGQFCGLARAMELVGERWAMLILRDLAVRPRRYSDLLTGLPGIPTNVLSTRLKELEQSGIVERRIAPAPQRGVVYAMTPAGRSLEPAILALGRWGATQLDEPRPGDIVTAEGFTMSLRAVFDSEAAAGVTACWQIRADEIEVYAAVTEGKLDAGIGPAPGEPDLVITFKPEHLPSFRALMRAAKCGLVELSGRHELLGTFIDLFAVRGAEA